MHPTPNLFKHASQFLMDGILDLCYPPRCEGCKMVIDSQSLLCVSCLRRLESPSTKDIGLHLARDPYNNEALDFAFCLWHFDKSGTLQRLQHLLKYSNRPQLGIPLGRWMGEHLREVLSPLAFDGLLPVPLHRIRQLERGYNQSMQLARGIHQTTQIPIVQDALIRSERTHSQTRLDRKARRDNVSGVFSISDPDWVYNRRILLIDDVLTTGATLASAAKTLKAGGARFVGAATLAFAH